MIFLFSRNKLHALLNRSDFLFHPAGSTNCNACIGNSHIYGKEGVWSVLFELPSITMMQWRILYWTGAAVFIVPAAIAKADEDNNSYWKYYDAIKYQTIDDIFQMSLIYVRYLPDRSNTYRTFLSKSVWHSLRSLAIYIQKLSLIHIWRCRRIERCRSRWSPYH